MSGELTNPNNYHTFLSDCGDDFLSILCECANYVVENLVAKKVMGTVLTGETLKAHVEVEF